ncbi:hypothetical protein HPB49_025363 [Dermacentor silvarum]|uniref:Uncharacterized protein n=1 Tax=Dermacentor silvarum TaxID=543639 RepID=A0ACB8CIF5_DERSI|nr:hypothetical protein HPB49_025363 [Dermacentor silvarum]
MKEKPVSLPSPAWNRHGMSMEGVESICFAELWKASATSLVIIIKSLELAMCGEGLKVSQYVFEREVSSKVFKVPCGLHEIPEITELLDSFHKSVVCGGGPAKSKFLGIQLECATADGLGFWRHRNCSLLLGASETQCRSCKSIDNTLRVHKARKEKRVKDTRIRLPVSPSTRPKLEALREQRIASYCSKLKLQKRKQAHIDELLKYKAQVKHLEDNEVEDLAKKAGFPEMPHVLLTECIAAAKATPKQGRRYTYNWLLLCLLPHIGSPSSYRFLRESDILPLPCFRTVRKYIATVGMKCGFDLDFFAALKKKLDEKSCFQRHDMLLFDEVLVRERKCVDSKTLTYIGLVDYGEDSGETSALANHGLVFVLSVRRKLSTTYRGVCIKGSGEGNCSEPVGAASDSDVRKLRRNC